MYSAHQVATDGYGNRIEANRFVVQNWFARVRVLMGFACQRGRSLLHKVSLCEVAFLYSARAHWTRLSG